MTKINHPNSNSSNKTFRIKNLLLASMLGLTLASCSYDGSDRDPKYVDNNDKKELILPNGNRIRAIKDWSDTGSPIHFKDEDGNRLLGGLDIESYQDLGNGKFLLITDNQKGIYDFTTDTYILNLDNYININKMNTSSSVMIASKLVGGNTQYDLIDISSNILITGDSEPQVVVGGSILMKSNGSYKLFDPSLTMIADSGSSQLPEVNSTGTGFITPSTPTVPTNIMVLGDSLTATPTIATGGEFYDIKGPNNSTIVKNCYQPINRGTHVYAVTDGGLDSEGNKIYNLHIINTVTKKKEIRTINEYEAYEYLP